MGRFADAADGIATDPHCCSFGRYLAELTAVERAELESIMDGRNNQDIRDLILIADGRAFDRHTISAHRRGTGPCRSS